EAARMVLADPGLVIVEPVEMDQKLHVAVERQQRVLGQRMKGREKNAGLEKSVVHGLVFVAGVAAAPIVAITPGLTSRPRGRPAGGSPVVACRTLTRRRSRPRTRPSPPAPGTSCARPACSCGSSDRRRPSAGSPRWPDRCRTG